MSATSGTRRAISQSQFLTILSREEALERFEAALFPRDLPTETVSLDNALNRVLAEDVTAPRDVPGFDRANVDGFAVRAEDLTHAGPMRPATLELNDEVLACGVAPRLPVTPGTATPISTGGVIPRGADAVLMLEHTEPLDEACIEVRRSLAPGRFIAFAGSDLARGETFLRAGARIGPPEIGMMAACGIDRVMVTRKPSVAVISTGDELVQPGEKAGPAQVHDANGAIVCATIRENGSDAHFVGAYPDVEIQLETAMRDALARHDMLVLSGGTSKGAGDVTYRILERLGEPGVIAHGVALKPGKPLCLAVCDGKPVVVLPGFPTSAIFTFQDMVVPVLRRLAGLPPRSDASVSARVAVQIPSELGRAEFAMVSLVRGEDGLVAYPTGKGSGAITSFTQADGFVRIDPLADEWPAGKTAEVSLFSPKLQLPDLVVIGSHCTGLDRILSLLARETIGARSIAIGSLGGLQAVKRGECDLAPIHLLDEKTGRYNSPFLGDGMELITGWRRMQGLVFRKGDPRFEGKRLEDALQAALADPDCLVVNRNAGSGTRILLDGLLKGARPAGYSNQPRSHNAVAVAVAQQRADWGMTIAPVAEASGLGFLPVAEEHYDFALRSSRRDRPAVQRFVEMLQSDEGREALRKAGFDPAI
ncbi:molybdopterin biosynthesis protein [Fulvimarina sp. MAC8]|uniref:molybdopterin biosynthesis protein n=1 Tax=Fulvimarina sp. MAC8 TaxID=3162874 RepID=UPI0032EF4718